MSSNGNVWIKKNCKKKKIEKWHKWWLAFKVKHTKTYNHGECFYFKLHLSLIKINFSTCARMCVSQVVVHVFLQPNGC